MGLVEKILMKLFKYRDIMGRGHGGSQTLYLRRFFILQTRWFKIFLHKICRSDDDPDPHDHPWNFATLILRGGYYDERHMWDGVERTELVGDKMTPGRVAYRKAEHIHRVRLLDESKPTWTLVLLGKRVRKWTFVTPNGPVYWREYLNEWSDEQID